MALTLRLKGPGGTKTCTFASSADLQALMRKAAEVFELSGDLDVMLGHPPKRCAAALSAKLSDLVENRVVVTVQPAVSKDDMQGDEAWIRAVGKIDVGFESCSEQELPVAVLPDLFLGDARSAQDLNKLRVLGVTHVLNVAGSGTNHKAIDYRSANIKYSELDASDEPNYPMLAKHLTEARAFIEAARRHSGIVLVHCLQGINRSEVLVAAEYMLSTGSCLLRTVEHIRNKRGNMCIMNSGFQAELVWLAREQGLLDSESRESATVSLMESQLATVAVPQLVTSPMT